MTEYYLIAKRGKKKLWEKKLSCVTISIPEAYQTWPTQGLKFKPSYAEVDIKAIIKDRRFESVIISSDTDGELEVSYAASESKRRTKKTRRVRD